MIDGGEPIDVGVLHVQAPRPQTHFDPAARVATARVAVRVGEANDHPSDSIRESSEGESHATLDVVPQDGGDIDVAFGNLNLHHRALALVA